MLVRWLMALALVCSLGVMVPQAADAARGYDPELTWQTLESPRFAVHFSEGQRNLAVRVSRISEQVIDSVGDLFGYQPDGTIHIVLSDSYDGANGSATVMPRNTIRLFLAAPVETTGLASYDEWLRILLIHEIAHICHIDQHHGLNSFLRLFVGKYVSMNAYSPQWMTEGVATYVETIMTSTGRGRSTYVDMLLRLAALGDKEIHLDQAHVLFSDWPGPTVAYFWGGRFHLYLAKRFGHERIRAFYETIASNPVPYIFSLIGWVEFGQPLALLWEDFLAEVKSEALELQAQVEAAGVSVTQPLIEDLKQMSGARFLDDGRVIFSHWSPVDGSTVRLFNPETQEESVVVRDTYSVRFGVKDGEVVYSRSAITERFNNYADLYSLDLETKKITKLQSDDLAVGKSLRARDPTLTPSGEVLFISNRLHQNEIKIGKRSADGKLEVRTLVPGSGDTQFSSPVVSPDGKMVAVSVFFPGGYRDIVLFDYETGSLERRVTADRALDNNPVFSKDGRYLLFDSDRSGVFNVYAYELESDDYFQVTNVVGGAFQPDVSPDGQTLLMRYAQAGGFALHTMPFEQSTWRKVSMIQDPKAELHEAEFKAGVTRDQEEPLEVNERFERLSPYQPWKSLMPSSDNFIILPAIFQFNGDWSMSLLTGGLDVLGEHSWGAAVRMGLETRNPSVVVSYSNDQWYPTLSTYVSKQEIPYQFRYLDAQDRIQSDWAFEARRGVGGSISWPIGQRHALFAGYSFETRDAYEGISQEVLSGASFGNFASSYAGYQYANLRSYQRSVSPERGVTASLVSRYFSKAFGATFDQLLLRTAGQLFLNNPLFDNHVLTMRVASAFSLGPEFKERFRLGGGFGNSLFSTQVDSFYPLRGFSSSIEEALEGSGLAALYMEYRFPIWYVQRGLGSLPLFADRFYGVLFMDSGSVFGREEGGDLASVYQGAWDELTKGRMSVGAELRGRLAMGWAYWIIPRVSIAFPIMDKGRFSDDLGYRFEFSLGSPF